jgi:hypothetical protein
MAGKPQFIDDSVTFHASFEHPSFGTVAFDYRPMTGKEMATARRDGLAGERSLEASVRLINRQVKAWNGKKPNGDPINFKSESDVEDMPVHLINGIAGLILDAVNEAGEAEKNSPPQ